MKEIELTKGFLTTVDDCDYDYLNNNFRWRVEPSRSTHYASCTRRTGDGKRRTLHAHYLIITSIVGPLAKGYCVDHIDNNGLNNVRNNLRLATNAQNLQNSRLYKNNKTGYRGVTVAPYGNKFVARIRVEKKLVHLGYFSDAKHAALAYNEAAVKHFGEFANLNVIEDKCQT